MRSHARRSFKKGAAKAPSWGRKLTAPELQISSCRAEEEGGRDMKIQLRPFCWAR